MLMAECSFQYIFRQTLKQLSSKVVLCSLKGIEIAIKIKFRPFGRNNSIYSKTFLQIFSIVFVLIKRHYTSLQTKSLCVQPS
jgi:hypothetical protein